MKTQKIPVLSRTVNVSLIVSMLVLSHPAHAWWDDPTDTTVESPATWVQQLAHTSFTKREQAQQELLKIGTSARAALEQGLTHADPEVRRSCRRLLADVLEKQYQQDLQAFIKDPQSNEGNDLPGWKRFQERVGNSPASRELFIKMQQAERGLLASLEAGNDAAAEALDTRFRQAYSRAYSRTAGKRQPPSLGSLAALLFVCGDPQLDLPQSITDNSYWVNLLQQPTIQKALQQGSNSNSLQLLLGDWIAKPNSTRSLYNKLRLSIQYRIPAGLQLAMSTLQENRNLSGSYQAYCVHVIAMMGGKNYASELNKLLTNETVCSRRIQTKNGKRLELVVEIRDVALAWLLFLHELDHKQYGMPSALATLKRTRMVTRVPSLSISTSSLGFADPKQRPVAHQKWQAYIADHPLPPIPKKLTVIPGPKPKPPQENKNNAAREAINRLRKAIPAKPAAKPQAKPAAKPQAKPAANPQAKPAANPQAKPAAKPQAKPAAKPQAKPAAKPQAKPAVQRVFIAPPAFRVPPPFFPGLRPQPPKEQSPKQVTVPGVPIADREMTRRLSLAKRAINEKDYAQAVILLGQILTAESDHTYQPDRDIPLSRGLKAAAEQVIGSMPSAGREIYELHFGSEAQQLLDKAVAAGEVQALARVSHHYFHTAAGAEATYLLGRHYLDHNHPLRGAMYFQRLQQKSHHRRKYQPILDIQAATCWALAGLSDRAEEVLLELKQQAPDVQLQVKGKNQGLFAQPGQALSWLADHIGPFTRSAISNSWPLFRGNSQRNQLSKGEVPYLEKPQWQLQDKPEQLLKQITSLRDNALDQRLPLLPSMQPLVVQDTVLLRTPTELLAVDRTTGTLLWKSPFDDSLRHLVHHSSQTLDEAQQESFERGLQRRLWNNPTFGTMSSDGKRAYSVEGLGFGDMQIEQRLIVMPDGTQRLDPGHLKSYNTLVAYDLETGKTVWEIGGPESQLANPLAGYFILGPPLPFGGRLYAIGMTQQQTRLLELDARTGSMIWQITLADGNLVEDAQQAKIRQTPFVLPQNRQFKSGATPSSSEGILVCPVSDSSFVAVNLTTRSILWIYDASNQESDQGRPMIFNPWQAQMAQSTAATGPTTWADTTVTIASGRVILTPRFTDKVLCLDLYTGDLKWSLPRGDGLYVAGTEGQNVIIVGRSQLSAVKLSDGSRAWQNETAEFPAGALPSGRGYLSPGKFHLPLTTAEVVVFDLANGHMKARSQSPSGIIPGNLVNCDGYIISQSSTGIHRFPSIAREQQTVARQINDEGENARLLTRSGEILLYAGRIQESVATLRKSLELQPDKQTSRLLAAAIVEGLRVDDNTFLDVAQELAPLLVKDEQNAQFLRQLIEIYQRSDKQQEAFQTCLRFIRLSPELDLLEDVAGTRRVRRDRWLAARLDEIWQAADQPLRETFLRELEPVLEELPASEALMLIDRIPLVHALQLAAATHALENNARGLAETWLRQVWQHGTPQQQGQAAARLARLYKTSRRFDVAARMYRFVAREYADQLVTETQTGTQFMASVSNDENIKPWLEGALDWPQKDPQQTETKRSHSSRYRLPMTIQRVASPVNQGVNIDVDSQGRTLTALNGNGKQIWQVKLPAPKTSMPFMGPAYNHLRGDLDGNLLIAWLGNRVCAIDGLDPAGKLVWVNSTLPETGQQPIRVPRPIFMGQRLAWQKNKLRATEAIPLAVSSTTVCYQRETQLVAVDRLTGKTLWSRDGFTAKSDLFGDDQFLFITAPDASQATVLSMLDGRQLGTRTLPKQKTRMMTQGRKLLTWSKSPEALTWKLHDPWHEKIIWQRSFTPGSQPTLINWQTVAVLEPRGHFLVQRITDGHILLDSKITDPGDFDHIVVLKDHDQYFLAVNRANGQDKFIPTSSNSGRFVVNGQLHAFQQDTQKLTWSVPIGPQLLSLDQSVNFPVLVFSVQTRKQTAPNKYTSAVDVHCVDKRTGKTVYKKTQPYSNQLVGIEAKPTRQMVELKFRSLLVQLNYGDPIKVPAKKESDEPPTKPEKKSTSSTEGVAEEVADRLRELFRRAGGLP